jgi:DNA-binding transcriptional LysR family regulator
MRRYPDMKVDVVTERRLIDIVADSFDAGIRPRNGQPSWPATESGSGRVGPAKYGGTWP